MDDEYEGDGGSCCGGDVWKMERSGVNGGQAQMRWRCSADGQWMLVGGKVEVMESSRGLMGNGR